MKRLALSAGPALNDALASSTAGVAAGAWVGAIDSATGTNLEVWDAVDLDADGDFDVLQDTGVVWIGTGAGFFRTGRLPCGAELLGDLNPVVSADFDGDGVDELVVGGGHYYIADALYLFDPTGAGLWADCEEIPTGMDPLSSMVQSLATGDLNGDGFVDLVVGMADADPPGTLPSTASVVVAGGDAIWCLGDGQGGFSCSPNGTGGVFQEADVFFADVDGSGPSEVVYGLAGAANCFPGCGEDPPLEPWVCSTSTGCPVASLDSPSDVHFADWSLADIDGDGDLDLIAAGYVPGAPYGTEDRLYINDGLGQFTWEVLDAPGTDGITWNLHPFDADGDGDLDLLRNQHNGSFAVVELCTQDAPLVFNCVLVASQAGHITPVGTDTSSGLIVDYDRDGDLDVLVRTGGQYVLSAQPFENDGDGGLTPADFEPTAYTWAHQLGWSDAFTVDLMGPAHLDASAPTTRVLIDPNRATAFQPPGTEARWWVRPGPGHAPIPIADDTLTVLPATDELTLHVELFTEDEETTPFIEALDVYVCAAPEDADGDGCDDLVDPSPSTPDTTDTDGDGLPDVCDTCDDPDRDGVPTAAATGDTSGCLAPAGVFDATPDNAEACVSSSADPSCDHCSPGWYHPRLAGDLDGDGLCAAADPDDDNDNCDDADDSFPLTENDFDGDGTCDDIDPDDDNDGCDDVADHAPLDPNNDEDGDGWIGGIFGIDPDCDQNDGTPCFPDPQHPLCVESPPGPPVAVAPEDGEEVQSPLELVTCCSSQQWVETHDAEVRVATDEELTDVVLQVRDDHFRRQDLEQRTDVELPPGTYWWDARVLSPVGYWSPFWTEGEDPLPARSFTVLPEPTPTPTDDDDSAVDDDDASPDDDDATPDDDDSATIDPPDCTCSSGPDSGWLLVLLPLLAARRRRR